MATLTAAVLVSIAAITSPNLDVSPATSAAATARVDTTPESIPLTADTVRNPRLHALDMADVVRWPVLASSVVEGVWSAGEPGLLQAVAVSTEADLPGAFHAHFELLGKWGHDGVPFPSSQGLSSLDAADFVAAGELWLGWDGPLGGRVEGVRVKVGRVDANTEFAASEVAGAFTNPSFGLSPAMAILPSYPAPAPAANLFIRLREHGPEAGAGLYRNGDGSWSAAGQVSGPVSGGPIHWSVGLAHPIGGSGPTGDRGGAYAILERAEGAFEPFVLLAAAGSDLPAPELVHLAAGFTKALAYRPLEPRMGMAASLVWSHASGDEAVAELFLTLRPLPWLTVQPDFQLRLADGAAPTHAALIRVAVER